jgi:putative nucleotidyltransferase with HDIG domain
MNLSDLVKNTHALPAAPEILPKLIAMMRNSDTDAGDVVSLIATDPSIVSGVLKLANSSLYAPPNPVTDLGEAVSMLGKREIYRIVSAVTSNSFLNGELSSMDIQKGGLWIHSLAVAHVMELIAEKHSPLDGLPYTLGLLHDIGKLALHHACGEVYADIFKQIETEKVSINRAESIKLGFDHAQAGAQMLEEWDFPEEVFIPIRYQYEPREAGEFKTLAAALQVANWAAGVIGCNDGRDTWALDMDNSVFPIDEETLERAILEAQDRVEKAKLALVNGPN